MKKPNTYKQLGEMVVVDLASTRNCAQILLLILTKFKRINWLLFPLKSSENLRFSDDFRGKLKLINSPKFA